MIVAFTPKGWADYRSWPADSKELAKLNTLIDDARRHPFAGLGKPEPLRNELAGWWSRRIDQQNRLVYRVAGGGDAQRIEISACRFHYTG